MREELLKILACPKCKAAPLLIGKDSSSETLTCSVCTGKYTVHDDIPNMLPENIAGDLSANSGEWSTWSEKIGNFIEWRKMTWNGSANAGKFQSSVDEIKDRFVAFTELRDSGKRIIDIGCGDGGLRTLLGSCSYFGVDPLLIEGCSYDFPMTRGVGEFLPFRNGTFDEAILNQVLDHCNSLDRVLEETMRVISAHGAINIMQYLSAPYNLATRIYHGLIKVYLALKGVKNLDTKTRRFDRKILANYLSERFEEVIFLEFSESQIFIRAAKPIGRGMKSEGLDREVR